MVPSPKSRPQHAVPDRGRRPASRRFRPPAGADPSRPPTARSPWPPYRFHAMSPSGTKQHQKKIAAASQRFTRTRIQAKTAVAAAERRPHHVGRDAHQLADPGRRVRGWLQRTWPRLWGPGRNANSVTVPPSAIATTAAPLLVQERHAQEKECRRERDLRYERHQGANAARATAAERRGQRRGRGGVRAHTVGSTTRLIRLGNSETRTPRTAAGARQAQS